MHIPKSCIANDFKRKEQERWQGCRNFKMTKSKRSMTNNYENMIAKIRFLEKRALQYKKVGKYSLFVLYIL